MGSMGRDQLVSEACLAVGDSSLAARLNVNLNTWLRSRATDQLWPETLKRGVTISLGQGVASLTVGAPPGGTPNNGIGDQIRMIIDPAWIYSSDYSVKAECRIRPWDGGTTDDDETINNPATNTGIPLRVKVKVAGFSPGQSQPLGAWTLVFTPVPDRAYLLALDYQYIPNDLDTTVGGADALTKPWYPNDDTMMDYLIAMGYRYKKQWNAYKEMLQIAADKTVNDRMKLGVVPGTNDVNGLDEGVFRQTPPTNLQKW